MITRWDEISDRTADKLGLPREMVRAAILDMATKTAEHASHPTVLETDLLGIGTLESRYGKLIKRVQALKTGIAVKEKYLNRYRSRGLPSNKAPAEKLERDIEIYLKDIEVFEEFIEQKNAIYNSRGRHNYVHGLLEANNLEVKDVNLAKRKISLSEDFKRWERSKAKLKDLYKKEKK